MAENMSIVTDGDLSEAFKLHPAGEVDPLIIAGLVAKLRISNAELERVRKMLVPEWFYADGYSSEDCHDSPNEVIESLELEPGLRVVSIDCAGPMPSIWCAVHVLTDAEKDALDTDDRAVITEHATEDQAKAALAQRQKGGEA